MGTAQDGIRQQLQDRNVESIALSLQRIAIAAERIADSMENDPLRALDAIMGGESLSGQSEGHSVDAGDQPADEIGDLVIGRLEATDHRQPLPHVTDPAARKWLGLDN